MKLGEKARRMLAYMAAQARPLQSIAGHVLADVAECQDQTVPLALQKPMRAGLVVCEPGRVRYGSSYRIAAGRLDDVLALLAEPEARDEPTLGWMPSVRDASVWGYAQRVGRG